MAADPFNSKSGYTVGIPPIPVIDGNGNLTVPQATIGNVVIQGNQVVGGNIQANLFLGTFQGNITGNLVVPGLDTWVLFNNQGNAGSSGTFRFDSTANTVLVDGTMAADTITVGVGSTELATTTSLLATTQSAATNQLLYATNANNVCSMDYTVIATDTVGNNRQTSKMFACVLGTSVEYYEYGTLFVPVSGPGVCDFAVRYNSGNIELVVTPGVSTLVNYKILVTSYKE